METFSTFKKKHSKPQLVLSAQIKTWIEALRWEQAKGNNNLEWSCE